MLKITEKIARHIGSNSMSAFFLNAPPGAGKTHLLSNLAVTLPEVVNLSPRLFVLGPYKVSTPGTGFEALKRPIYDELVDALFLSEEADYKPELSLMEFFNFLQDTIKVPNKQNFLVLYDLQNYTKLHTKEIAPIFSQIRALGERWKDGNLRFSIVSAGCWDHYNLVEYYENTQTSWSYIPGENYIAFQGVEQQDAAVIGSKFNLREVGLPYESFLFNLCGGHPGCIVEVMQTIDLENISFSALLSAVNQAAQNGTYAEKLVKYWGEFFVEIKPIISRLLKQKKISASTTLPTQLIQCVDYGILSQKIINEHSYLSFRSWYVELIIRHHLKELGLNHEDNYPEISEIIPDMTSICAEAYKLINQIENLVRNFVSAHLWAQKTKPGDHPLKDKLIRFSGEKKREDDIYERALDWKEYSAKRNVKSANLNPMIAFSSTSSLADLVNDIGNEIGSLAWVEISRAIREMAGVRDAIMHNQIIDDTDMKMLYEIQEKVFKALSQTE